MKLIFLGPPGAGKGTIADLAAPATRDEIAARGREVARGWPDRAGTARAWEEKYARVLG